MTHDPLAPDRHAARREHLMSEITATHDAAMAPVVGDPRGSRWPVKRLVVAAAAVAAIAGGALTALSVTGGPSGVGATAFAVARLPHGQISIRVVSTAASAKQMTDQLHARGLAISVQTMPATRQMVGTWIAISSSEDFPQSLSKDLAKQAFGHSVTLDMPAHFTGSLDLTLAVAAEAGQDPEVSGLRNALAPGGVLACSALPGTRPNHAATVLRRMGYTVLGFTTSVGQPLPTNQYLTDAPPGTRVTGAFIEDMSPTDFFQVVPGTERNVAIQIASPTDPQYQQRLHAGFAPSQSLRGC
jgi:hypothetical protein